MIKYINGVEHVSGIDAQERFLSTSDALFRAWRASGMPYVRLNGKYWYPVAACHQWFATSGNGKEFIYMPKK